MTAPARPLVRRVGLVVPSSNTTMETEVPALLRRQSLAGGPAYVCHSARLRLRDVRAEALRAMNEGAGEAAASLCEAGVDALMYACLVAAMVDGRASMASTRERLLAATAATASVPSGTPALVTSADALIAALGALGARSIAMITPYREELAASVAATMAEHGIDARRTVALQVTDNLAVGRLSQEDLLARACRLDLRGCDALVVSACVQMPSLDVVEEAERRLGLPVLSAATASVWQLLASLGETPRIPGAGSLLRSGLRAAQRVAA